MQKKSSCILAFDMGGTFIKYACVLPDGSLADDVHMLPSYSGESFEAIMKSWSQAVLELVQEADAAKLDILGIGISTPGPFDFVNGRSLMKQKFQALYGIGLADEIRRSTNLPASIPFSFIQDANAFLAGEHLCGAASESLCCAGITLGTGLGFSSMVDGNLLTNGRGAPYIALYRQPYSGGILEDVVSARGICLAYRNCAGILDDQRISAKDVGLLAKMGDESAQFVMAEMGRVLGKNIANLLSHTYTECLVIGGQISKDFALFEHSLKESLKNVECLKAIVPAAYPEDAALYGAAAQFTNRLA